MKKVLVTGQFGYIGTKFKEWIGDNNRNINLEYISVRDESWKEKDFSQYDSVLHLAGIAHTSKNPKFKEKYYKINRDLTLDLAEKAKKEGVSQFIFMSSIIVYGQANSTKDHCPILKGTVPNPDDFYGDSKLQADIKIQNMNDSNFKSVVIRTPVVYGPNCKGNFPKLLRLAKITPFFVSFENKKSMIFIDNLNSLIEEIIIKESSGVFYPQNSEYVSVSDIVKTAAENYGRSLVMINIFNSTLKKLNSKSVFINKVFGSKFYEKDMSIESINNYQKVKFVESIKKSMQ